MPAPAPAIPAILTGAYITCVAGVSALSYCALIAAIIKISRSGLYHAVAQLALADFILIGTSLWSELLSCNAKTWTFTARECTAYRGLSVFASTASLYLVANIALHTIATVSLEEKESKRIFKRDDDENIEIRSSSHSLVARSDSSTPPRTMNVDFRLRDTRIPVYLPSIIVWILSASLSIPEFVLVSSVKIKNESVLCTIFEPNFELNLYWMFAIFNLILSLIISFSAGILVFNKLITINKLYINDKSELRAALNLSVTLIIVYVVMCVPRSVVKIYGGRSTVSDAAPATEDDGYISSDLSLGVNSLFMAALLVRPLLCIGLLPRVREALCYSRRDGSVDDV